jgi:hypothetical protein
MDLNSASLSMLSVERILRLLLGGVGWLVLFSLVVELGVDRSSEDAITSWTTGGKRGSATGWAGIGRGVGDFVNEVGADTSGTKSISIQVSS